MSETTGRHAIERQSSERAREQNVALIEQARVDEAAGNDSTSATRPYRRLRGFFGDHTLLTR